MEKLGIFLEKSVTMKYSPIFEAVHFEILLIVTGIILSFPLIWIILNAKPLHQNLRIILVVCILEVVVLFLTRPALIYLQFCDLKTNSIFRMTGITFERLIATIYWEWYERHFHSTLTVAIGVIFATAIFVFWNTLHIIGVFQTDSSLVHASAEIFAIREIGSPVAAAFTLLSCVLYAALLICNKYELRRQHRGLAESYSLAHTYQLKENVAMMEMLLRMLGPAFVLCIPAFVFRAVHHFLPHTDTFEFTRALSLSMFDAWISLVSTIMVFIFPLFNDRFRKPASKVLCYRRILNLLNRRRNDRGKALCGVIGLLANLFLLVLVVSSRTSTTMPAYRFAIAASAVQGAFNSILLLAGLWTHILSDGYFISIVYGPLKFATKWLRDSLLYSSFFRVTKEAKKCNIHFMDVVQSIAVFMVFSLWHFITAPCIVQYLVLFRKRISNIARVAIAYLFTGFSMALSAPYITLLVPFPEIDEQMKAIVRRVHELQDSEFIVVYGIGMRQDPANGNRTTFALAFYGIAPSYLLTAAMFAFTVFKQELNDSKHYKTLIIAQNRSRARPSEYWAEHEHDSATVGFHSHTAHSGKPYQWCTGNRPAL
ncbi:hypothetical protein PRIPAC_82657 [Pristionchus pacificus]|uniref:G protein-coupled receptor n=1 Tax=Pristionchus pacificus TaxID=54126 RepID=A0A2A6CM64_PRIPA|nr:hypothetical protein PRIPAC_82657 [Pristionchus pacificus]|eukprot:PDM79143.1 G protein-coupled receptor [Pristionchus pacificus]